MKYVFPLKKEHYQHIIDISEVSIGLNNKKLLCSIKVPFFEIGEYRIQHLIPIPEQHRNQFLIPIPKEQFIFLNNPRTMYVPTSEIEISKCKLLEKIKVCERSHPTYLLADTHTCGNQIIRSSIKTLDMSVCEIFILKIDHLVFISLAEVQGYIVIPEKVIDLNINCENKIEDVRITEVTLLSSENNCILTTESTIVKLRKSSEMSKYISYKKISRSLMQATT